MPFSYPLWLLRGARRQKKPSRLRSETPARTRRCATSRSRRDASRSAFAKQASASKKVLIQDINVLSARIGLKDWFDWPRWYVYKIITTTDASLAIARSLTAMVRAIYGKSRKCLVLDLDNTLWGGIIGDDGPDKIKLGHDSCPRSRRRYPRFDRRTAPLIVRHSCHAAVSRAPRVKIRKR